MAAKQSKAPPSPLLPGRRLEAPTLGTDHESISLTDVFGPNFRDSYIEKEITLRSRKLNSLVRRDYLFLCRMLHTFTRAREFRGIDHVALNKIEDAISVKIDGVRQLVAIKLTDLAKKFSAAPDAKVESLTGRATAYRAPVASPHAFAYLQLLEEADEFFNRQDAAYLQKVTGSSQDHYNRAREVWNALVKVKAAITQGRAACFAMLKRASADVEPGTPEAEQLHAEIKDVAAGLTADAATDGEVREDLSVSQLHDLQSSVAAPDTIAAAPAAQAESALARAK